MTSPNATSPSVARTSRWNSRFAGDRRGRFVRIEVKAPRPARGSEPRAPRSPGTGRSSRRRAKGGPLAAPAEDEADGHGIRRKRVLGRLRVRRLRVVHEPDATHLPDELEP